jgi:hypothetical protein
MMPRAGAVIARLDFWDRQYCRIRGLLAGVTTDVCMSGII